MNELMPCFETEDYKARFKPLLNSMQSEFVNLCPKPIS